MKQLEDYVTTIPDFPKKGIMFRDITTILNDKDGFKLAVDGLIEALKDVDFDVVAGSESRGFIFGAPVAYAMNKAFVLVRKKGKPRITNSKTVLRPSRCTRMRSRRVRRSSSSTT